MFGTVSTWRLRDSVRDADAYRSFLREMVNRNIDLAREACMIDSLLVRVEPDTLIGIAIYESADDAEAAARITRREVGAIYADRLELVSRRSGRMDDMPSLPPRKTVPGVDGTAQLYVSISSWRLHESIRDETAFSAYVAQVMDQNVELAQKIGLLDVIVIRVSADTIVTIGVYDTEEALQDAIARSTRLYEDWYTSHLQFVDRQVGRADDIPQLVARSD